ncbi:MAG TPA: DUF3606 domain-containing protein [Rudaea sp.]|jgi:hypothetical protein
MSTLWEMAASMREEMPTGNVGSAPVQMRRRAIVDLNAPGQMEYWCKVLGTTPLRLYCAVDEVGSDPTAIRRFLMRSASPILRVAARA